MTAQTARQKPLESVSRATSLKAALYKAMASLGFKNGTAAPGKEDTLHLLYVYNEVRGYFDKLYKAHLEAVFKAYDLEDSCEKSPIGEATLLVDEQYYALTLKRTSPSSRVDLDKFTTELRRRGVSQKHIEEAREAATYDTKPARRFEVVVK